jgi:hypothetical protein
VGTFLLIDVRAVFVETELRQRLNNLNSSQRHSDDTLDQIDDVTRVALFEAPLVDVVDDARFLVGFDVPAVDEPVAGSGGFIARTIKPCATNCVVKVLTRRVVRADTKQQQNESEVGHQRDKECRADSFRPA